MNYSLLQQCAGVFAFLVVIGFSQARDAASEAVSATPRSARAESETGAGRGIESRDADRASRSQEAEAAEAARGEKKQAAEKSGEAKRIEPLMLLLQILRGPK